MSVRRLAEEQPESFAFNRANAVVARQWIDKYPKGRQQSAVIPLLMLAQDQEGWVTKPAIEQVSRMLEMPLIRVLEVATFYTQFQLKPVGTRAHVQVCGTTPCMLRGSEALMDVCREKIHHEQFQTNADGTLSWEEVECLGACVNAPMIMIFKDTYEDLTPERLGEIIDAFEAGRGASVKPGTQLKDRFTSEPEGERTTLLDEAATSKSGSRRAKAGAADGGKTDEPSVPPSKASRPKTHAAETDASLKSPSPKKATSTQEDAASVPPLPLNERRANETLDDKGAPGRQRKGMPGGPAPKSAYKSPELLQGGEIGPDAKRTPRAAKAPPSPGKPTLDSPNRPVGIPKPDAPDDLKLISGVGPRIETILNGLGIYKFEQVASWKKNQCGWVDGYLNFRGRIDRDDWVKQAKALAKGGEAEYFRVFGKKPR
jgi:NADH-quinone oxidoreductase subunit E